MTDFKPKDYPISPENIISARRMLNKARTFRCQDTVCGWNELSENLIGPVSHMIALLERAQSNLASKAMARDEKQLFSDICALLVALLARVEGQTNA